MDSTGIIGSIYSINGPVVKVKGSRDYKMLEMVFVGMMKTLYVYKIWYYVYFLFYIERIERLLFQAV